MAFPLCSHSQGLQWKVVDGLKALELKASLIDVEIEATGPWILTTATFHFPANLKATEFLHKVDSPVKLLGWGSQSQMAKAIKSDPPEDSCIRKIPARVAHFPGFAAIPLAKKGQERTIVLHWETWLNPDDDGYRYELPPALLNTDSLVMRFTAHAQEFAPEMKLPGASGLVLFKKVKERYVCETSFAPTPKNQTLRVFLPKNLDPWQLTMERTGKETYFVAIARHDLQPREAKLPGKIALVWDVSSAGQGRDLELETALLDSFLKICKKVEVELIPFSTHEHPRQQITVEDGNTETLLRALAVLHYDGAPAPGNVQWQSIKADMILFVGEGTPRWGSIPELAPKAPFMAFHAGASARNVWIEQAAIKSGGKNLGRIGTMEDALNALKTDFPKAVKVHHGGSFSEMFAVPNVPQGLVAVSGKFNEKTGKFSAAVGYGKETVTKSSLEIAWDAQRGKGTRLFLLNKRIQVHNAARTQEQPKQALLDLCLKQDIASPWTRLALVDEMEAYLNGRCLAPASLAKADSIKKGISELKAAEDSLQKHQEMIRLAELSDEWAIRKSWWRAQDSTTTVKQKDAASKEKTPTSGFGTDPDWQPVLSARAQGVKVKRDAFQMPAWEPEYPPHCYLIDAAVFKSMPDSVKTMKMDIVWISGPQAAAKLGKNIGNGAVSMLSPLPLSQGWRHNAVLIGLPWDSAQYYLRPLKVCPENRLPEAYAKSKVAYGNMPAFFWDAARVAGERQQTQLMLQILSNLVEIEDAGGALLRSVGNSLLRLAMPQEALPFFERATRMPDAEPQAFRDLAYALEKSGNPKAALEVLLKAVKADWSAVHDLFGGIEAVLLNDLWGMVGRHNLPKPASLPKELNPLPCDIRVTASWNRMDVDVDLWVMEPGGARCDHQNGETSIGGYFPVDFADGFGPEEYLLRHAQPGNYQIGIDYFLEDKPNFTGPSIVTVRVAKHFGTAQEETTEFDVEVRGSKGSKAVTILQWPAKS